MSSNGSAGVVSGSVGSVGPSNAMQDNHHHDHSNFTLPSTLPVNLVIPLIILPMLLSFLVALSANVVAVWALVRLLPRDLLWHPTAFLLLNACVADLAFAATMPLWIAEIFHGYWWHFGDALCKVVYASPPFNMVSGLYFVVLMTLEAAVRARPASAVAAVPGWAPPAVARRLASALFGSRRGLAATASVVWLASSAAALPFLLTWKVLDFYVIAFCGLTEHPAASQAFFFSFIVVAYLVPLAVAGGAGATLASAFAAGVHGSREKKAARLSLALAAARLACDLPTHVIFLVKAGHDIILPGSELAELVLFAKPALCAAIVAAHAPTLVGTFWKSDARRSLEKDIGYGGGGDGGGGGYGGGEGGSDERCGVSDGVVLWLGADEQEEVVAEVVAAGEVVMEAQ
ncbi:unnamed protein product [Lampetra fluviatilis]